MTLVHLLSMAAQAVQERAEVKKQSRKSENYDQLMKNATRKDKSKVKNPEAHHEADAFDKKGNPTPKNFLWRFFSFKFYLKFCEQNSCEKICWRKNRKSSVISLLHFKQLQHENASFFFYSKIENNSHWFGLSNVIILGCWKYIFWAILIEIFRLECINLKFTRS